MSLGDEVTTLEKDIVLAVDRLMKCSKSQEPKLIRKLQGLWAKRARSVERVSNSKLVKETHSTDAFFSSAPCVISKKKHNDSKKRNSPD